MTIKLFQEDAYLKECEAKVVSISEQGIELDQTIFYPLGGGQPGDTGCLLTSSGESIDIVDTRKCKEDADSIRHIASTIPETLAVGDSVKAIINWDLRYRYMRTHTCLHLLGALLKFPVTGGSISKEKGRLDFDMPESPDKAELTEQINALVQQNRPLEFSWISDEELQANMELVRTMSVKPPMGAGKVRLVNIPEVDLQPCGGTHVRNTSEVGQVLIKKIEKKGKQNRRVNLVLVD